MPFPCARLGLQSWVSRPAPLLPSLIGFPPSVPGHPLPAPAILPAHCPAVPLCFSNFSQQLGGGGCSQCLHGLDSVSAPALRYPGALCSGLGSDEARAPRPSGAHRPASAAPGAAVQPPCCGVDVTSYKLRASGPLRALETIQLRGTRTQTAAQAAPQPQSTQTEPLPTTLCPPPHPGNRESAAEDFSLNKAQPASHGKPEEAEGPGRGAGGDCPESLGNSPMVTLVEVEPKPVSASLQATEAQGAN